MKDFLSIVNILLLAISEEERHLKSKTDQQNGILVIGGLLLRCLRVV